MTLLRQPSSLRYVCAHCHGHFRFAVIEGPQDLPHLTIALLCPFCGHNTLRLHSDQRT